MIKVLCMMSEPYISSVLKGSTEIQFTIHVKTLKGSTKVV